MEFEELFRECLEGVEIVEPPSSSEADGRISPSLVSEILKHLDGGPGSTSPTDRRPDGSRTISDIVSEIKQLQLRKFINRSIIKCGSSEEAVCVSRELCRTITRDRHRTTTGLVAIVPHLSTIPHVHVWHDCNPRQGMCRCSLIGEFRRKTLPFLCTRETVRGYRPLRGVSTEEEKKGDGEYYRHMLQ